MAVATSEDGGPAGCPQQVDDCENAVYEDKTPSLASDDPMGRTEPRTLTWSEAQGSRTMIDQNNNILQQNIDVVHDCTKFEQSDARRICIREKQ